MTLKGLRRDLLRQKPALLVAHVSRRGADKARDVVLLHEVGHVDANQRVGIAEEELRERLGDQRLAHARGAQEDEGAQRPARGGQPRAGPADCRGDDGDGLLLADDLLVQLLLDVQELLAIRSARCATAGCRSCRR